MQEQEKDFSKPTHDGAVIDKQQAWIGTTQKEIGRYVLVNAQSCVLHAIKHGDVTKADKLLSLLKEYRAEKVRRWFKKNGPFKWDGKNEKFSLDKKLRDDLLPSLDNVDAFVATIAQPIFKDDPKKKTTTEAKEFVLLDAVAKVVARANKLSEAKDQTADLRGLNELKQLCKKLKREQQPQAKPALIDRANAEDAQVVAGP